MLLRILWAAIMLLGASPAAFAKPTSGPPADPTREDFLEYCRAHSAGAEVVVFNSAARHAFYPLKALVASQGRYSFERFKSALKKDLKKTPTKYDAKNAQWSFAYDQGRSMLPLSKTITGVFYRGKIHVIDGHHKVLSSLYLGGLTIPVHLVGDWSDLSPQEFVAQMQSQHYSYFRDSLGKPIPHRHWCDLIDDANLQLARFLFRKVEIEYSNERLKIIDTSGSEFPIMLKINDDIPFFEFEVADTLRRHGVDFDPRRSDDDIGRKERQAYLDILASEATRTDSRLAEVLLLARPTRAARLDVRQILESYISENGCESLLVRSPSL